MHPLWIFAIVLVVLCAVCFFVGVRHSKQVGSVEATAKSDVAAAETAAKAAVSDAKKNL